LTTHQYQFEPGASFFLPEIMTRIPARAHHKVDDIELRSAAWVRQNLAFAFASEQHLERYLLTRCAYFACLIWPMTRDEWMLDLANLSQYLFAFDDAYGDRAGIGRDSKSAWKVFDDFFVVMAGDSPRSGHPYALIFQDIWGRVALPMTAGQRSRHRKATEDWLKDCVREIASREKGMVFDFDTYLAVRRGSVYSTPCFPIIEHGLGIELPEHFCTSRELADLHLLCTDCMILINDLFSFQKEALDGDFVNAVTILCMRHELGLQQAVDRVCEILHAAEGTFLEKCRDMLANNEDLRPILSPYLTALGDYMSGLLHWARLTTRYHGSGYVWNGLTSGIVTLGKTGTIMSPRQRPERDAAAQSAAERSGELGLTR